MYLNQSYTTFFFNLVWKYAIRDVQENQVGLKWDIRLWSELMM
jgi:hypothetical protein